MDRISFLKNGIGALLGIGIAKKSMAIANEETQIKTVKHNIELTINGRKPGEKVSYLTWVRTDFENFDNYLTNKDYPNLEKAYDKLYASVRWYLNRLKHEDIKNWEDNLKDADMFNRSEAVSIITTIVNKISKRFPLIDCKNKYYKDWSTHAYYNNLTALGEANLLISKNEDAYRVFYTIKENYIAYTHKDFKNYNPFGWVASILNENDLFEKAYEFAKLDQEHRIDGTNSRLFKQLSKQLKK